MTSSTLRPGRHRARRTGSRRPTPPAPRGGAARPRMPMSMITYPAVCRLKTEVFVVTAKARIAPMPISTSPIPVFMTVLPLGERPASALRRGKGGRGVGGFGRIDQLASQVRQGSGQEPGDVHLRDAEPVTNLRLGQVAVEAHDQDALLA